MEEDDLTPEEHAAYRLFRGYARKTSAHSELLGVQFTILTERGFYGLRLHCRRFEAAVWLTTRAAYRRRVLAHGPYRNA